MINFLYQTWIDEQHLPNSLPIHKRTMESFLSCDFNNVKRHYLEELLDEYGIEYHNHKLSNIDQNKKYYYLIEPEWIDKSFYYENVLYLIDDDVINLVQNDIVDIIIFFPTEGFSCDMEHFLYDIHWTIQERNIPFSKVHLVFGDLNIEYNYECWINSNNFEKINVYPFDIFHLNYNFEYNLLYKNNLDIQKTQLVTENDLNIINRPYTFLCKNANPREHRLFFVSELYRKNLNDYGIISFLNRYFTPQKIYNSKQFLTEEDHFLENEIENYSEYFIKEKTPIILDEDAESINIGLKQRFLNKYHFNNTYFSVINETIFESGFHSPLFLTEKTYIPIVQYHPFIILGPPEILKYLKSLGFETFPEFFDERYDTVYEKEHRMKLVFNEVEKLTAMNNDIKNQIFNEVKDKLIFNHNHFFNLNFKKFLITLFENINGKSLPS